MNVLKILRNSKFAIILALIILTFSCSKYDLNNQNEFDYSLYKEYLVNPISNFDNSIRGQNSLGKIINSINIEHKISIALPENLSSMRDFSWQNVKNITLSNAYILPHDVALIGSFLEDLENTNFDSSISNFENNVLNLSLDETEFSKYNTLANVIKAVNDNDANFFNVRSADPGDCIMAILGLIIAILNLYTCPTLIRCFVAYIGFLGAVYSMQSCNTNKL